MALSAVDALVRENARLRSEAEQRVLEIERRQRVAEGLRDLLAIVNSGHKLDEILAEVLAQSSRLLGNDAGIVYMCDEEQPDILRARASMGMDLERARSAGAHRLADDRARGRAGPHAGLP